MLCLYSALPVVKDPPEALWASLKAAMKLRILQNSTEAPARVHGFENLALPGWGLDTTLWSLIRQAGDWSHTGRRNCRVGLIFLDLDSLIGADSCKVSEQYKRKLAAQASIGWNAKYHC